MTSDLDRLATLTQAVYDRNADRFDADRPKGLHERPWLDRFGRLLPSGGCILDLGCGTGTPIAGHFLASGFRVTGLDASRRMIRMARSRWPQGDWRIGDMRDLDLPDPVDGIIGWNSFFYLTRAEQRALLPRLADLLAPGGALMLTVGPDDGAAAGRVGVDRVHHTSLSQAAYRTILARAGMAVIAFVVEDPGCDFQTILLARKRVAVPA